jgi:putative ABC transport system substrate-binding protein
VPIIFNGVSDPVRRCVVDSLLKPGRNATGYMHYLHADSTKRMETLQQAFPDMREVLFLVDHLNVLSPGCEEDSRYWTEKVSEPCVAGPRPADAYLNRRVAADALAAHARALGLQATFVVMCELSDLGSLAQWAKGRTSAAWQVPWQDRFDGNRQLLVNELNGSGLPAIFPHHGFTRVGGLMSLAAIADTDLDRPSVQSLVQVVLGASPATLPVQMPRGFSFTINARAAEQSGLKPTLHALRVADTILH